MQLRRAGRTDVIVNGWFAAVVGALVIAALAAVAATVLVDPLVWDSDPAHPSAPLALRSRA